MGLSLIFSVHVVLHFSVFHVLADFRHAMATRPFAACMLLYCISYLIYIFVCSKLSPRGFGVVGRRVRWPLGSGGGPRARSAGGASGLWDEMGARMSGVGSRFGYPAFGSSRYRVSEDSRSGWVHLACFMFSRWIRSWDLKRNSMNCGRSSAGWDAIPRSSVNLCHPRFSTKKV